MNSVAIFVLLTISSVAGRSIMDSRDSVNFRQDFQFRETAASLVLDNSVSGNRRSAEYGNTLQRKLEKRNIVVQLWQSVSTSTLFRLIRTILVALTASVVNLIPHLAVIDRVKNVVPRSYYGYGVYDQSSSFSVDWFAVGQVIFRTLVKDVRQ